MKALAIVCLTAASVFASAANAQTASPADEISGNAVFCQGSYALCIRAPCAAVPSRDAQGNYTSDQVLCSCVVESGWSMGPAQCSERTPVKKGGLTFLMSTYSNRFNTQDKTLSCDNADTQWAWCYGAPCVVDPRDPKSATCNCPVRTGPMRTLGGKCSQKSCDLIWSAATPAADKFANQHFYDYMKANQPGYPVNAPAPACLRTGSR